MSSVRQSTIKCCKSGNLKMIKWLKSKYNEIDYTDNLIISHNRKFRIIDTCFSKKHYKILRWFINQWDWNNKMLANTIFYHYSIEIPTIYKIKWLLKYTPKIFINNDIYQNIHIEIDLSNKIVKNIFKLIIRLGIYSKYEHKRKIIIYKRKLTKTQRKIINASYLVTHLIFSYIEEHK